MATGETSARKSLVIREAKPEELEEVILMDLECDLEIMRLNGSRPKNIERIAREHRRIFLSTYKQPVVQRIFVAATGDKLVGFIWVRIEPEMEEMSPVGFIESIFVKKGFRGNGIGKALIRRAEQFCRERRVSRVELVVNAKNANAIRFYRKMGFRTRRYTLEIELVPAG